MLLEWVAADGTVRALSDLSDDVDLEEGVSGRFAPPVEFSTEQVPFEAGSRVRQVRIGDREVAVPVLVACDSPSALNVRLRDLTVQMAPTRGRGALRDVTSGRQLPCYYAGGLEVVEGFNSATIGWARAMLVFRAFDPFWEDAADTTRVFSLGSDLDNLMPYPPYSLISDTVGATPTVVNDGDVDAWPVWTVIGPADQVTLENTTSGASLTVDRPLTAADWLRIDSRPGVKTIVDQDGVNRYGDRTAGSELWPLVEGSQDLQITLGSVTADSKVELAYRRRWLTV